MVFVAVLTRLVLLLPHVCRPAEVEVGQSFFFFDGTGISWSLFRVLVAEFN